MATNRFRRSLRFRWSHFVARFRTRITTTIWTWHATGRNIEFGRQLFVNHPEVITVGNNVRIGNDVEIINSPDSEIVIGDDSIIESNTVIKVNYAGKLNIGRNTKINKFNYISCNNLITIGDHTMTAAFCHILDSNHGVARDQNMRNQDKVILETHIGSDVWIGTMCTVLAGTRIENGVVVGANSTTRGSLESYGIYAGNPCKKIKSRE